MDTTCDAIIHGSNRSSNVGLDSGCRLKTGIRIEIEMRECVTLFSSYEAETAALIGPLEGCQETQRHLEKAHKGGKGEFRRVADTP